MSSEVIAVTGAAGHIGGELIRRLVERQPDTRIRAIDIHRRQDIRHPNVEWIAGDVRDRAAMAAGLEGVDTVINLAAVITIAPETSEAAWEINTDGPETVAAAALAAGVTRLVHCSSIHAFDCAAVDGTVDEHAPRATDVRLPLYDRSKAEGERRIRRYIDLGLDAVILHPTGVLGPGDPGTSLSTRLVRHVVSGSMPMVVGSPFDWVDVRDVAQALVAAIDHGQTGRSYIVGGTWITLTELSRIAAEHAGRRSPRPIPLALAQIAARLSDRVGPAAYRGLLTSDAMTALRHARPVNDRPARHDLGHDPRPIDETVRDLVDWIRSTHPNA